MVDILYMYINRCDASHKAGGFPKPTDLDLTHTQIFQAPGLLRIAAVQVMSEQGHDELASCSHHLTSLGMSILNAYI